VTSNWLRLLALVLLEVFLVTGVGALANADMRPDEGVDTALIVSVDVSQSVDEKRYRLQIEGIAQALQDPGVIASIIGGPKGGILFMMITWADRANIALGWRRMPDWSPGKERFDRL